MSIRPRHPRPDPDLPADQREAGSDPGAGDRTAGHRRAQVRLPPDLTAPRLARQFLRELRWQLTPELADDAELVACELVTNAIRHAQTSAELRLELADHVLHIAVRDSDQTPARPQAAAVYDENGRGLALVTALSISWGCQSQPDGGKIVWAELSRLPKR